MVSDWQSRLAGVSDEQIMRGLDNLPKDWPPTVDEFRLLSMGGDVSKGLSHNTAAYTHFGRELLLVKKADKAKAKSALGRQREILSGGSSVRDRQRALDDAERLLFGGD